MYRQSEKNLLNSNTSPTRPHNTVNFGPQAADVCWRVWGTPANFNGVRLLAPLLHGTLVVGVSQTLRRWTDDAIMPPKFGRAAIMLRIGPHSSFQLRLGCFVRNLKVEFSVAVLCITSTSTNATNFRLANKIASYFTLQILLVTAVNKLYATYFVTLVLFYADVAFLGLYWLWSPYVIGQTIIFSSCFFLLSSSFFPSPNLSGRRLDVYHTLAHGVALVRI